VGRPAAGKFQWLRLVLPVAITVAPLLIVLLFWPHLIIVGAAVSTALAISFIIAARLRHRSSTSPQQTLGLLAALCAVIVDALYVVAIIRQGNVDEPWRVVFVASFIALLALSAGLGGALPEMWWASALLAFAAIGLVALGALALFSIGIGLLLAGGIALVALVQALARGRSRRARVAALIAAGLPVLLLVGGFYVVGRLPPGCPSDASHLEGSMSDGGTTTHYVCENGRLIRWWTDAR
jgi:hypothetical protein